MLSILLYFLLFAYVAINLVLFGSALVFYPVKTALDYLFFGTLIVIRDFIRW